MSVDQEAKIELLARELNEAREEQAATSDVLRAISTSPTDAQPVFDMIASSAARLCHARFSFVYRFDGTLLHLMAHYGLSPAAAEFVQRQFPMVAHRQTAGARAVTTGSVIQIPDTREDTDYVRAISDVIDTRSILAVPMMRDEASIGAIALDRAETGYFPERQIELLQTFASQAVIAIQNVRLFEEVQARTKELSRSLEELRTAQDRLIQTEKLASLGQLTAGIAHEIKNPMNFVNNFSALSVELVDELRQMLRNIVIDDTVRLEVDQLAEMLKGNLSKIEQHGKRADSIVKNMLLHSRQGSGEHRPVDINAIVEESLNLAYHGARAERQGFNITLETSLDPAAGEVDLYPQEITRVLLNLISNGFYATGKRAAVEAGNGYEPTLRAVTKNLGESVEIRIRDNGTGIPPEVRERMFNPFFTTKPAGEGTGLGLSLSHDIIVTQHAGTIEVDSEPGQYTELRIVLPRSAATVARSKENP